MRRASTLNAPFPQIFRLPRRNDRYQLTQVARTMPAATAVIIVDGCARQRFTWSKPEATYNQYLNDRFDRFKQPPPSEPDKISVMLFKACMSAKV
jgi:hypothetical protein